MFKIQKISNIYVVYGPGKRRLPGDFKTQAQAMAFIACGKAKREFDSLLKSLFGESKTQSQALPEEVITLSPETEEVLADTADVIVPNSVPLADPLQRLATPAYKPYTRGNAGRKRGGKNG